MKLRHCLPINWYYTLVFLKDFLIQKNESVVLPKRPKFWLLDVPSYGNLGDQAITQASVYFLKKYFPGHDIVEVPETRIISRLNWVKRHISPSDTIVLAGGGNLGNLYPRYEFIRRKIIRSFPYNPIIIFPQSVYFSDTWHGRCEQKQSARIYAKHPYLTLCARDPKSANKMKELFPNNKVVLCPDIVFFLIECFPLLTKQDTVGICLREDTEKTISEDVKNKVLSSVKSHFTRFINLSTLVEHNDISAALRKELVTKKLQDFSACKLIVTDRLHGLIFSYITQTPCLLIPSLTGKTTDLYNHWLCQANSVVLYQQGKTLRLPEAQVNKPLDFSHLLEAIRTLVYRGGQL